MRKGLILLAAAAGSSGFAQPGPVVRLRAEVRLTTPSTDVSREARPAAQRIVAGDGR